MQTSKVQSDVTINMTVVSKSGAVDKEVEKDIFSNKRSTKIS